MRVLPGVFCDELSARTAIIEKKIRPGDCIVIPYAGPRAAHAGNVLYHRSTLCGPAAVVYHRYYYRWPVSGASRGPCIGHISPEAASGGPIGLIRDGDKIRIDIPNRCIDVLDVDLDTRRPLTDRQLEKKPGILGVYQSLAVSAMEGGYMHV